MKNITGFFSIYTALVFGLLGTGLAVAESDHIEYEYGGSILYDVDDFDGVYNFDKDAEGIDKGQGEGDRVSELRRGQLYLKAAIGKDWSTKLQLGYNEARGSTEVKDAYIRYKGWDFANITIGQDKEPFSMDLMTALKNSSAIEKSVASRAFSIGRNLGVNFSAANKDYSWSVGVYEVGEYDSVNVQESGGNLAVTGRFTLSPINSDRQVLHFGGSFSTRDLESAEFEVESNAEVQTAMDVLDTRNFAADSIDQYGLESAWIKDRLALTGEAFYQDVKADLSTDSAVYSGYYLQGSLFLSDDSLRYKKGRFSKVKPTADSGAWQLVARRSYLDAEDNQDGLEIRNTMLGVNYYYRKTIKLMLNYTRTQLTGYDVEALDSGDAVSLRAQYRF